MSLWVPFGTCTNVTGKSATLLPHTSHFVFPFMLNHLIAHSLCRSLRSPLQLHCILSQLPPSFRGTRHILHTASSSRISSSFWLTSKRTENTNLFIYLLTYHSCNNGSFHRIILFPFCLILGAMLYDTKDKSITLGIYWYLLMACDCIIKYDIYVMMKKEAKFTDLNIYFSSLQANRQIYTKKM